MESEAEGLSEVPRQEGGPSLDAQGDMEIELGDEEQATTEEPGAFAMDFKVALRRQELESVADPERVNAGGVQELSIDGLRHKDGSACMEPVLSRVMAEVYGSLPDGETAEERWEQTGVETIWTERFTDDKLVRKVSYIGTTLKVLADPSDFCTPLWNVTREEIPAEQAEYFAPPSVELVGAEHWRALTQHLPNDLTALNAQTEARLCGKLRAQFPGNASLQHRLRLEGAIGLWELSIQKHYSSIFTDDTLAALIQGVSSEMPDVVWACTAAIWHAVASSQLRARLVAAGAVAGLIGLLRRTARMKDEKRWRRAMTAHALGALSILAVDPAARKDVFAQDPGLRCLVSLGVRRLEEDLSEPSPPSTPSTSESDDSEEEEATGGSRAAGSSGKPSRAASHAGDQTGGGSRWRKGDRSSRQVTSFMGHAERGKELGPGDRQPSVPPTFVDGYIIPGEGTHPELEQGEEENEVSRESGDGEEVGGATVAVAEEPVWDVVRGDLLNLEARVYSTRWRRKVATDTVCSLLVRDVDGRVTFAQHRGSEALLSLARVGDSHLDTVVAHVLTALARDNRPRGEGLPLGVVLIAESGMDVVQALLHKLTIDLQIELEQKLRRARLGPGRPTPEGGAGRRGDRPQSARPRSAAGPRRESSSMDDDRARSQQGEEEERLALMACAMWGTAGAAMRPGMAGFDMSVILALLKSSFDAVELHVRHGMALHRTLHCLAGVLYLATTDKSLSRTLIDLHHAGPEVDCIALLQTMAGTSLMGGSNSPYPPEAHVRILAAAALTSLVVHDDSKPVGMGQAKDIELALTGPYRQTLRDAGTIPILLNTLDDLPRDPIWRTQLPQLASCAIMYMATVYAPMRGEQMEAIVRLMETRVTWDLPTAAYLSAATWCLARHPENRAWMLRDPEERTAHAIVNMVNQHRDELDETVQASIAREAMRKQREEMRAAAAKGELSSWMGGLKGSGGTSLTGRSIRSVGTSRSKQVQGWSFGNEAESPAMRLAEYSVAVLWILAWKQLTAAAKAASAKEMFKEDSTSWWGMRMHAETTTAPLSAVQQGTVQLLSDMLCMPTCNATIVLKTTVVSVLWSLSHASGRVEAMVVDNEMGGELMAIVEDLTLSSSCQQAAVGFLLLLSARAETLAELGGVERLAGVVVALASKAVRPVPTSRLPGAVPVIDVDLLEFSVRGLARLTTTDGGMAAIVKLGGIATLAAAVRADLRAMEHLVRIAPEQDWEKVYPLRRVTTLEKVYGALDGMTAEDAEEEGVAEILLGIQDEELEDGDAGMLALWALLNMSTFPGAQRPIAHHCLLTLLKLTYVSPSQQKANVASHILSHIRKNKENVTIFYRAELKMKSAFLASAAGVPSDDRAIKQIKEPVVRGFGGGEAGGLPGLLEVDSEDAAVMNARARNAFLEWASDPEEGPASLHPLIAKEKSEEEGAYVPTYLKDAMARKKAKPFRGKMSKKDQDKLDAYDEARQEAFVTFGSIRSYRGQFMRSTLFQALQAHCASMWKHVVNIETEDATESRAEEEGGGWRLGVEPIPEGEEWEDAADPELLHPGDAAFVEEHGEGGPPASYRGHRASRAGKVYTGGRRPPSGRRPESANRRISVGGAEDGDRRGGGGPPSARVPRSAASGNARPASAVSRVNSGGGATRGAAPPRRPASAHPTPPHNPSTRPAARPSSALERSPSRAGETPSAGAHRSGNNGPRNSAQRRPSTAPPRRAAATHPRPSSAVSRRPYSSSRDGEVLTPTVRPAELLSVREVAAVSPSLTKLDTSRAAPTPSPRAASARSGRPSSAQLAIVPRPLSATGAASTASVGSQHHQHHQHASGSALYPYRPSAAHRSASASTTGGVTSKMAPVSAGGSTARRSSANSRPTSARNWEPRVDSYVQDGRLAYNPPEVSRRLLTAHCPREVEERLVNASSRLAQDPTVLVDLMKGVDAGKKAKTPRLGRPASAVSALTLGTEPSSEWSEVDEEDTEGAAEAAAAAAEKIGRDIRMSRPDTGYAHSHTGSVRPLAEGLTSLWDREIPRELQKAPDELSRPPPNIPRPLAILDTDSSPHGLTPEEIQRLGIRPTVAAKLAAAAQTGDKFLKVVLSMREKEPQAVYTFKEYPTNGKTAPIIVFEHVDGCKFCEQLYGHFLLPNGKLAHFYARDAGLRRGRFVALAEPPTPALSLTDLLQPSFLAPPVFVNDLKHPGRPYAEFVKLFGLPLPPLGPPPPLQSLRVRRAAPEDDRFPAGWRLDQSTGMSFTARPVDAHRLDTLSVSLADDLPATAGWELASSVWEQRAAESDARAFFDSPVVVREQAEKDWGQIDRCAGFKAWFDSAVPGGYNAHAAGLRAAMLTVFDAIKQSFHYYCITGLGSPFALSPKEFAHFLMDAGVVDDDNPALTKKRCLAFFKDTVEHCRIPQYQPKEIKPKKKRAKKTEEASKPMTRAKVKEAPKMSDPEIIRPEFAQVVIRLAIFMFGARLNSECEAEDPPFVVDAAVDAGDCLTRFVHDVMAKNLPQAAFINPNEFRFKRLYTKEVDDVLRGDFTCPSAELLRLLYARQSVQRKTEAAEVKGMTMVTWLELLDTCGLIGTSPMGLQVSLVDARACFMMAKMAIANDTLHHLRWESATFCEFMEALGRVADCISWPEPEVLSARGGFSCLYEYLKKDPKMRPRLPRRPSFGISTPKSRPLAPKLRELLNLIFQVFAEVTIFSPARLKSKLTKELKKSAIKGRVYATDYFPGQGTAGLNYCNPPARKKKPPPPPVADSTPAATAADNGPTTAASGTTPAAPLPSPAVEGDPATDGGAEGAPSGEVDAAAGASEAAGRGAGVDGGDGSEGVTHDVFDGTAMRLALPPVDSAADGTPAVVAEKEAPRNNSAVGQ